MLLFCYCSLVFFFFFKQKTAYEMRISDWSSDVCSSDLSLLLNITLDQKQIRLYGATYSEAPQTSPLIRTNLDRDNTMFFVSPETRPLVGLYWGNSAPGTTQNQKGFGSGDRSRMYHLDADNSLLCGLGNQLDRRRVVGGKGG